MVQQIILTSFETFFLTGLLPLEFATETSLYYDISLVFACQIFSTIMIVVQHCSFFLKIRGADLQSATHVNGKWLRIPEPQNKTAVV
jgi:hypothetical protein